MLFRVCVLSCFVYQKSKPISIFFVSCQIAGPTFDHGFFYTHSQNSKLVGYADIDYGGDLDNGKNPSGYAFHISSAIFAWSSKKQQTIALSTCEAEYIAATACACQAMWLAYILSKLNLANENPVTIFLDNKYVIHS